MKKLLYLTLFIVNITFAQKPYIANPKPVEKQDVPVLAIGSKAPDFKLPAADGKWYSLKDFAKYKTLVVLFTCNHCPTAQAYEDRVIKLVNDYKDKGVGMVAISPNSPIGLLYEELGYTDLNDDFDAMKIRIKDKKYNFPYLYDGDNEAVSIKYGPVATPHVYVFDNQRVLKYQGRLDALERPEKGGNSEDVRRALDEVIAGKPVSVESTKVFGCSTKWAWKNEYVEKTEKNWKARPVTVEELDTQGIKDLVANKDSKKLRLINVWATWCGPCCLEYPDFLVLQRMYGQRDFEFVSVSADKIDKKEKALKFLQDSHSGVKNYIFKEDDIYKLIEAIDPKWNGALPYTLMVEPNGKVVFAQQGTFDFQVLKKTIVDNKMIGRYF
jgi:peroxiredoxin